MIRIMLVDDQVMLRAGLKTIVESHPELEVAGEAGDGIEAVQLAQELTPDVILMDIRMPGIDGVEATRRIRELLPPEKVRILVLTTFEQDENVLAAIRAGADGFLGKGASPTELIDGILQVFRGDHAMSPTAVGALTRHAVAPAQPSGDPELKQLFSYLTERELEVVKLVVQGLGNEEIGDAIFISPYTAKTHVSHAMVKVGARDRAQLVSLAVRAGI